MKTVRFRINNEILFPHKTVPLDYFNCNESYDGDWENELYHGDGILTNQVGDMYIGHFLWGKQHGQGTMIYINGNTYTGCWNFGKKHGQGTMTYTNGDKKEGFWNYDKLQNGIWSAIQFDKSVKQVAIIDGKPPVHLI